LKKNQKNDEQTIPKMARVREISPVGGGKVYSGRICGTGKFLAWNETLKA